MDAKKIERAAKEAMEREMRMTGTKDIEKVIIKAISAAIAEYDKQKSE